MENEDSIMSERESMELITSMINKAKNRFSENGFLYLLWGWVIFICCLGQFIMLYIFQNENAYYIWYLSWLAVVFQIFYLRKTRKYRRAKTYTDEIGRYVWVVFLICITLLVVIMIKSGNINSINPVILVMYGMPLFLSGIILRFRPLIVGSICCWALSFLSLFTGYNFQLLLVAAAILFGWIIPGYLLQRRYKKQI
ncbi:MAG: hypothetical protein ABI123_08345 [Ginsengibacter sp.]|jgi:uncharacterized membrane protein YiaA